ncbi:MAG: helix-hairpin-helix domain-containing protein [Gammaproteobacteria bacterium]|nr:helix-hairpin-helix domain-containing protein [Gammaproteobacteria bacterium]
MVLLRICLCWLLLQPVVAAQTVNVNTADAAQLASALSGIGEKKAQLIVAWRKEHGPFKSLDDVAKVKGLGPKLIERNKDIIVFSPSSNRIRLQEKGDSAHSTLNWPTSSHAR